jgi:hypothetical protein
MISMSLRMVRSSHLRVERRTHARDGGSMEPQWVISVIAIIIVAVIAWRVWGGR